MSKSYDSIEYSFLESVMSELGFSSLFISWTMRCISSISYSMLINGIPISLSLLRKAYDKEVLCLLFSLPLLWNTFLDP